MISRTFDIIALWYHLFRWYHVTCAANWCWLGGQQTRDCCPAELRWTWSSAWTCCSGCCTSSELAGSCSSSSSLCNLKLQVQVEAPHWQCQWAWSLNMCLSLTCTAQVGHLVIALGSQVWSVSQTGVSARHLESLSDWQQPQGYNGSCNTSMS
jgi:hypothetical protein